MYSCPGCGASLKFDIREQKMKCSHCNNLYEVNELSDNNSYNTEQFEANVFVCSQCGGTIYSQENDLTGVCSYCGSYTTFQSRIDQIDRPKWILPFKIEKDQCKKSYAETVKRAFFAPKELKNPEFIDGMRGVYMPYWIHDYNYDKNVNFKAHKEKAEFYSDHFLLQESEISFHLSGDYYALRQDASKGFSNELAQQLKPYNISKLEDFSPAYLCGFYGETADLDKNTAKGSPNEVKDGNLRIESFVTGKFPYHNLKYLKSQYNKITHEENKLALMPVWFLSYRNGKRVSYSAVNGRTGKLISEIPISFPKFAACSALLTTVLFLLLNTFLVMKLEYVALVAAVTACLALYFCKMDLNMLTRKECGNAAHLKDNSNKVYPIAITFAVVIGLIMTLDSFGKFSGLSFLMTRMIPCITCLACTIMGIVNLVQISKDEKIRRWHNVKVFPGYILAFIAIFTSTIVEFIHPVSDIIYWGVGFASLGLVALSLLSVVYYHNCMSSRKLPQFNHMGGDDHA